MSVRKIIPKDTLEAGFRTKYNETVDEIPTSASLDPSGVLQIVKYNNSKIEVDLTGLFYTESEVNEIIEGIVNIIASKPFEYTANQLNNGSIILDHDLNTLTPEVVIYADNVRDAGEVNTRVECFDNGKGLANSVKLTHFGGGINYKVKVRK